MTKTSEWSGKVVFVLNEEEITKDLRAMLKTTV
jgi:hypothetical protein